MIKKILISDPISELGLEQLKDAGLEVLYKPESSEDEIHSMLSDIDGWIIRSGTKINKEFIHDAKKLQIIGRAGVGVEGSETATSGVVLIVP